MTVTNQELVREFLRSGKAGSSANMDVTQFEGHAFLWDYGWALIAYRDPDEHVYVYTGWEGYSPTTSNHLHLLMMSHHIFIDLSWVDIEEVDERPGQAEGADSLLDTDGREELEEFDYNEIKA